MKTYTQRMGSFALILTLLLSLVACGGSGEDSERVIDHTIIETYIYLPEFSTLAHVSAGIQGAMVHNGRIYYYYMELYFPDRDDTAPDEWVLPTSTIVVEHMLPDGTNLSRTEIPNAGAFVDIAALSITEAGDLTLLFTDSEGMGPEHRTSIVYAHYNPQGVELTRRELEGIVPPNSGRFHIEQALVTKDGGMALLAIVDGRSVVYLLDEDLTLHHQMEPDGFTQVMGQTQDGRVLVVDAPSMREIKLETGTFGDTFPIPTGNIRGLHPARVGDTFDLYIDDGTHLFGYNLTTGAQTMLLNWTEANLAGSQSFHLNFVDNRRLSLLSGNMIGGSFDNWHTEHALLVRTPRADLPEWETLTLGGFYIYRGVLAQVAAFNRSNQAYQIEIKDYFMYSSYDDFDPGWQRFLLDILTGRGPDIILGDPFQVNTLASSGMLTDLYPLIDADPDMSRSDFFPNILSEMEMPDGTLPMIANSFSIQTMIGLADMVGDIESWTFSAMLELIEHTDAPFLLGDWMTSARFLETALQRSDYDFIDWAENRVNVDNEAFIQLLEISARLPNDIDPAISAAWEVWDPRNPDTAPPCSMTRMLRGEQLLELAHISDTRSYRMYRGAFGDDMVALGMPTRDGGAHAFTMGAGFAISATSRHPDAAWSFIRQTLLPSADVRWSFPLRIDLFEAMIAEDMIPYMVTDEDGNEVELPMGSSGMGGIMIDIYALTEAEVVSLRALVDGARIRSRYEETVMEMIREETLPFFAGDRSSADTARILQNRIQTYLSEQG